MKQKLRKAAPFLVAWAVFVMVLGALAMFTRTAQAWDCRRYNFRVTSGGDVQVENRSGSDEPAQKADVYVPADHFSGTVDVPAMPAGTGWTFLLNFVPPAGDWTWKVVGSKDCQDSGEHEGEDPTKTPKPTDTPEATVTPSDTPTDTQEPPTATPTPSHTVEPSDTPQDTPTPTKEPTATRPPPDPSDTPTATRPPPDPSDTPTATRPPPTKEKTPEPTPTSTSEVTTPTPSCVTITPTVHPTAPLICPVSQQCCCCQAEGPGYVFGELEFDEDAEQFLALMADKIGLQVRQGSDNVALEIAARHGQLEAIAASTQDVADAIRQLAIVTMLVGVALGLGLVGLGYGLSRKQ